MDEFKMFTDNCGQDYYEGVATMKSYLWKHAQLGLAAFFVASICLWNPAVAKAEVEFKDLPSIVKSASLGGEVFTTWRGDNSAFFTKDKDYRWAEGHAKLHVNAVMANDVEANFGLVYKWTAGEDFYSDPLFFGYTYRDDGLATSNSSDFTVDTAYLKFNTVFDSPFSITVGKQYYELEKQFLVSDGTKDADSATWLNSERAFPIAVRVDADFGKLQATLFGAKIDSNDARAEELFGNGLYLYNANLHYDFSDAFYAYGGYLQQRDTDFDDDTAAAYAGADLTLGNLHFEGEYVLEFGDMAGDVDRDAWAYFFSADYTFADAATSPYVRATILSFSGDDVDTADKREDFYGFSYGFTGWGTWFLGEIVGEQQVFNSNMTCYKAEAGFYPTEWLHAKAMYFKTMINEKEAFGLTEDDYADEVNLLFEFPIAPDFVFGGILLGAAKPGDAAEEMWGDDETAYVIMPHMVYVF